MKLALAVSIAIFSFVNTITAQESVNQVTLDSLNIVQLEEVHVVGIRKPLHQKMLHYYKSNNAATLEDILSRLPELSLTRRGTMGMEPAIRYLNGGQINVQIDGMNIHGACTDKMDPASIYVEPINLENLQVQTANSGFINGSSIGGTLNFKMAEPVFMEDKKITGQFNSGYQTASNGFYESLRINYNSSRWAFRASGTYRNHQDYTSGGGNLVPFSQYQKMNYSFSAKYQQNAHSYIKLDFLGDDGWNIGYAGLPMDVGYAAARIGSISYYHEQPKTKLSKWMAKIYSNSVRHFMDDSKRPFVPMHMDMPGESKTSGFITEWNLNVSKRQQFQFRADGSTTFLKASMTMYQTGQVPMYMLTWPNNHRNQIGMGATWQYLLDSSSSIKLNGRFDLNESSLNTVEAKNHVAIFDPEFHGRTDFLKNIALQFSNKTLKHFNISSSLGYTERMPTASELFGFYLFNASDRYDYIGHPALQPERSLQADLSLVYRLKQSSLELNVYYAKVSNFIVGKVNTAYSIMTIGAYGVKTYSNIPFATVSGAELSGFLHLANEIDYVMTMRYTNAIDNENQYLPFVAPLKTISSIRYQHYPFSAQLESETALSQNNISNKYGEDITKGFSLLHARFGYNFKALQNELGLQFGVENIFDKLYHEHLDVGNIPRPGRNIYVQLKLDLK
jgi:iron complex outermembrane receptor protein